MSKKKIIKDLKEYFQQGIVSDSILATYHYFIWRTVGENFQSIKDLNNVNSDKLFGHLQESSENLAILHLAKVFDKKNSLYLVRSLDQFLEHEFEKTSYFPLTTKDYIEFSLIYSRLNINSIPEKFDHPIELSNFFKDILCSENVKFKVENLKFIRSKFLAHNEHDVDYSCLGGFWVDFLFIVDFLKIFISLFGVTVLNSHYFQFENFKEGSLHYSIISDAYWLVETIQEKVGKKNFIQWWD